MGFCVATYTERVKPFASAPDPKVNLPVFIVFETVVVEPVIRNLLEYQDLQRHICLNR